LSQPSQTPVWWRKQAVSQFMVNVDALLIACLSSRPVYIALKSILTNAVKCKSIYINLGSALNLSIRISTISRPEYEKNE
jgi:hypothetical protein